MGQKQRQQSNSATLIWDLVQAQRVCCCLTTISVLPTAHHACVLANAVNQLYLQEWSQPNNTTPVEQVCGFAF